MKRKIGIKLLLIIFLVVFIGFSFVGLIAFKKDIFLKNKKVEEVGLQENYKQPEVTNSNIVSLYCWNIEDINLSKLKKEIEYLKINTLYVQKPSNEKQEDRLQQIMEFAKQNKLDVFLLDSAFDWLTTGDMSNVTKLIDKAYELNKKLDYKLKGVSLDVEFYLTDEYKQAEKERQLELFQIFTKNTKKSCDYANSLGLEYSMSLPVWLNKLSEEELENLMNYKYHHIAFMNYYKETIMDNLDEEVKLAKKHKIKIVSVAEVQDPKYGTVGEEDTFYNDGLKKCMDILDEIKQKYNYENLGVSYHHYGPLLSLLEKDTDSKIENSYEVEVNPYEGQSSKKVDQATIRSDGKNLQSISGYHNEEKKYYIRFYGLEYGKKYTLTLKSGNQTVTKTFEYQKGDKDLDEHEIAYIKVDLEEEKNQNVLDQEETNEKNDNSLQGITKEENSDKTAINTIEEEDNQIVSVPDTNSNKKSITIFGFLFFIIGINMIKIQKKLS